MSIESKGVRAFLRAVPIEAHRSNTTAASPKLSAFADMLRLAFRTDSLAESGDKLPDTSSFRVHVHMEQPKVPDLLPPHWTPQSAKQCDTPVVHGTRLTRLSCLTCLT
jgi:hypothetical protein